MNDRLHIAIIIDSLKPGGAERVASVMANCWAQKLKQVTLITLKKECPFYELDDRVNYRKLGISNRSPSWFSGILNTFSRITSLCRCLKEINPDVVISFFPDINILSIISSRITGIPVIINERTHPGKRSIQRRWKLASRLFYRFANRLVIQTEGAGQFFRNFGVKTSVVPNPVRAQNNQGYYVRENLIISAGRLVPLKGFDRLIRAFAQSSVYPEWKLAILGEGSERDSLENLSREVGVKEYVSMPGLVKNIDKYYQRASIFVSSSFYEGFPNALAEAMSSGIPCISFDCEFGPSELIRDNKNGMLITEGNIDHMAEAIYELANDAHKREHLGNQAKADMEKLFSVDRVMSEWENVVMEVVQEK
jgi:glycosyltransferase involved in cell wall biosynthesis